VPTCNVGRYEGDTDPVTGNHLFTRSCLCSRRQCQIKKHADPSKFAVLVDTSMNGTRLNGVRVVRDQEYELRHGDTIGVGLDPDNSEWVSTTFRVCDLRLTH
jgi:pSer/pThr/pTyr-binding forkhead associated (FHA) protein